MALHSLSGAMPMALRPISDTRVCIAAQSRFVWNPALRGRVSSQKSGLVVALWHRQGMWRNQLRSCQLQCATRKGKMIVRCHGGKVKFRLRLDHQVEFGEHHAVIGSADFMGSWKNHVSMTWTESGWVADIEASPGDRAEFKYVIVAGDGRLTWEEGPNRVLDVPSGGSEIVSQWENPDLVVTTNGAAAEAHVEAPVHEKKDKKEKAKETVTASSDGDMSFSQGWQGKNVAFMKANEHTSRQGGKWETAGLEGAALRIVEGDKKSGNWWRKLEVVRDLLTDDLGKADRLDALVYSSTYLKWISTGQIQCFEDGGHYRPNKHAEISRMIFRELESIYSDKTTTTTEERVVIRKIHPCLPSFKAEFTAAVPLTRIRDIAHRNDIPHDLKQEIKHTIQNKLHRNAGPEDLVATEALLARVTKTPGEYSAAFVEQLKIFHGELKDFFNASSLTERLDGLRPSLDEQQISVMDNFMEKKKKLDEVGDGGNSDMLVGAMHALTGLRAVLLKGLESGLRNDASDDAIAMRQKWRLSEIGLEDYFFVLLSRFLNAMDSSGGAKSLSEEIQSKSTSKWKQPLGGVVLGIRQLGLSGWQQAECLAIENELMTWEKDGICGKGMSIILFVFSNLSGSLGSEEDIRMWGLRLKATLDRTHRMAETYSDLLLKLYPKRAQNLGNALGIPENSVRTYAEAEIRASVVFQLSKLCTLLLKAIRFVLHTEGWDVLMPGIACGKLFEVQKIVPGSLPSSAEGPVILLVKQADGDEEVRAAGPNVAGVILQQELPHLSHLGVRARQEKVVFVTCDDDDKIKEMRSLLGKSIKLESSSVGVRVSTQGAEQGASSTARETEKGAHDEASVSESKVVKSSSGVILDLKDADLATAGAKSSACGKLATLAELSAEEQNNGVSCKFLVPPGLVIPFGSMEGALESSGSMDTFHDLLEQTETAQVEEGELDGICNQLRELVSSQRLPKSAMSKIAEGFSSDARLIVRSSANVEDLAGMSGAGLYDSIPNVKLSEPENFCKAVAGVWASLYTRRAVLSRRVAKVPQKAASMAVLVQELLAPDLSFVLHTVDPIDRNAQIVQGELAAGLGETLASGTRGTPWRLSANKVDGSVKLVAFANFSEEFVAGRDGVADGKVSKRVVDYSTKKLSVDLEYSVTLGQRLAAIGTFLEKSFGCPQDIEGCAVGEEIYIVQARPQP
ncbi:phosphoglucan, water dikinase, chloroplastic isoform X1 [Selaginella moellendorffii]|uniref:phosphoglucan, water dikinase, chloroplastic isoform X1 n=1 Tax=Selaginella moellendorffii TaxID=88036 RepID=UPI000D1C72F1|nr:phosphoglucan, water dikinase, chloroplastic isoform X1 [Selaginella moellendorffii]|eukprot:XP_024534041.1 phosphoglucan, water dikinase, chloroplastic isoform X1 [Selaginella moellendorffii]